MARAALPDNPDAASGDPNARRIVAYGLRDPFRFGLRPETGEICIGDVGWSTWEEIQRLQSPTAAVTNFGWPCYEGAGRQGGYDAANLSICENLYAAGAGAVQAPFYAWNHSALVVPGETCPTGSSSAAGIAFAPVNGGGYPGEYGGALFFADYSRDCIWAMLPGSDGVPDPARRRTFAAGAANPVNLQIGPGGDLFYVDFDGGTVRRGAYGDATGVAPRYTYYSAGVYTASLHLTDGDGASGTAAVTITIGNAPPTASIGSPAPGTTWRVGDVIQFAGGATDAQDGPLPPSALEWHLILHHCPSNSTRTRCSRTPGSPAARSRHRTTSTRPTSSCGSPRRTPAG